MMLLIQVIDLKFDLFVTYLVISYFYKLVNQFKHELMQDGAEIPVLDQCDYG